VWVITQGQPLQKYVKSVLMQCCWRFHPSWIWCCAIQSIALNISKYCSALIFKEMQAHFNKSMNYFNKRGKNFYEWPHYNNHTPKVRTKSVIKLHKTSAQYDTYSSTNIFLWPSDCSFCTCTIKEIKEN